MGHTYVANLIHCIFSTKERKRLITPEVQERLWPFMGGIARANDVKPMEIGGVGDHAHLLLAISPKMPLAKAIQLIKGGSSKWAGENFPELRDFEWQEGYAAFSVSQSMVDRTVQYIRNQRKHHSTTTFEDEFLAFLKKHGVQYDPRYVFG